MDLLKMDKNMFLSIFNMKLRDEFGDIEDLCSFYEIKKEELLQKLKEFNLYYEREINQIKNI